MTESALGSALRALVPIEIPETRLIRRNVMAAQIGDRFIRSGVRGMADYEWWVPREPFGLRCEVELKAHNGRMSDDQKRWRSFCERMRVPYFLLEQLASETPDQTVNRWVKTLLDWTRSLP